MWINHRFLELNKLSDGEIEIPGIVPPEKSNQQRTNQHYFNSSRRMESLINLWSKIILFHFNKLIELNDKRCITLERLFKE